MKAEITLVPSQCRIGSVSVYTIYHQKPFIHLGLHSVCEIKGTLWTFL